jgi:hypothetical protein
MLGNVKMPQLWIAAEFEMKQKHGSSVVGICINISWNKHFLVCQALHTWLSDKGLSGCDKKDFEESTK